MHADPCQKSEQDKPKERDFFNAHADAGSYDVFTPESNMRLIEIYMRLASIKPGAKIADLGCGSGVFSGLLQQRGFVSVGVDISPKLLARGKMKYPYVKFLRGDVEHLPFPDESFDSVLLGGVVHHFPDPSRCASEAFRVLKPGGSFVAFDPNRMNPFVYLYRDRSSWFYSSVGVTANERPVLAHQIATVFRQSGFKVRTDFTSDLRYRYLASSKLRWLLPAYNAINRVLFTPEFMKPFRMFVLTYGEKL